MLGETVHHYTYADEAQYELAKPVSGELDVWWFLQEVELSTHREQETVESVVLGGSAAP